MRFRLEVDAATVDGAELARALSAVAAVMRHGNHAPGERGGVRDSAGNTVGSWIIGREDGSPTPVAEVKA